jgi:hypothetical protein
VGGTSVGAVDPDGVAGRVEVARTAGVLVDISPAACAQELNSKRINRTRVIFLIILFSWGFQNQLIASLPLQHLKCVNSYVISIV